MKKLTLTAGLIASMLSANAQDTLCTYFKDKNVFHFDYHQDTILYVEIQKEKYYHINLKYGDVLCLDLSDDKLRVRKVTSTFFDGSTSTQILDSKDHIYYSNFGVTKVLVGKPKLAIKL